MASILSPTSELETTLPSLATTARDMHEVVYCHYRGSKCTNVRAVKRDGMLHTLCDFHRRRANLNQRRLQHKRRQSRAMTSPISRWRDTRMWEASTYSITPLEDSPESDFLSFDTTLPSDLEPTWLDWNLVVEALQDEQFACVA